MSETEKPQLGPRAITAYNRLAMELGALNYALRVAKPSGLLGETARRSLNRLIHSTNRLYRREPGMPRFAHVDPIDPMSVADVTLLVARLTAAGLAFEARYAHLTEEGRPAAPWRDGSGLPSPHA